MKKYIFLVKQHCKKNGDSFVVRAFSKIEDAENYRHVFYDVDCKYFGTVEMIELH